jgi:hypothetical protein
LGLAVAAAVSEARANSILIPASYPGARRRAVLLTAGGLAITLLGCVLLSTALAETSRQLLAGLVAALAMGGFGALLAGAFSLVAVYGIDYAGRRIQEGNDTGR